MSTTQTETVTNGDKPTSLTINHITSYPLPSDILNLFSSHPLGAKSLSLLQNIYVTLNTSLSPYLQTPYSILRPYLERADNIGNNTLSSLDERFPAVKETDLNTVKSNAGKVVAYPFALVGQGREYVVSTYTDEYEKVGGNENLVRTAKSAVSTELRITRDGLNKVVEFLGPKSQEAKERFGGEVEKTRKLVVDNLARLQKYAGQKGAQAQQVAEEKKEQVANGRA